LFIHIQGMQINKLLSVLLIVGVVGVGVLSIALSSWQKSTIAAGCPALTESGEIDPADTAAVWNGSPVAALTALAKNIEANKVLGSSNEEKWVDVDLSDQKLIAYEGDKVFMETLVSTGLFGKTAPGEYHVWYKIRATKMEGGVPGTGSYYYLPNVPYVMFFNGDVGIHGTYWHQNFGTPMSHGCVNTPTPSAEKLFYWTNPQLPEDKLVIRATEDNPGTRILVHE
jgi:hypothetical protein